MNFFPRNFKKNNICLNINIFCNKIIYCHLKSMNCLLDIFIILFLYDLKKNLTDPKLLMTRILLHF